MIPRGLLSVECSGPRWIAYALVGRVPCWCTADSRGDAIDGLLAFVDVHLVAILSTDPTLARSLATVH